jgi:hypothetical protein
MVPRELQCYCDSVDDHYLFGVPIPDLPGICLKAEKILGKATFFLTIKRTDLLLENEWCGCAFRVHYTEDGGIRPDLPAACLRAEGIELDDEDDEDESKYSNT